VAELPLISDLASIDSKFTSLLQFLVGPAPRAETGSHSFSKSRTGTSKVGHQLRATYIFACLTGAVQGGGGMGSMKVWRHVVGTNKISVPGAGGGSAHRAAAAGDSRRL
jgi:hypothetical protein